MRCEGEARLALQKPSPGRISAGHLVVEKKSRAEFRQPVEGDAITVEGELNADVRCSGIVRVLKNGRLEGRIETTSLVVEKGGVLHGPCVIRPPAKPAPAQEQAETEAATENSSAPAGNPAPADAPAPEGDAARPN